LFEELYDWYLEMLSDDDQAIIRFLRKTGEEHMARKPTSPGRTTSSSDSGLKREFVAPELWHPLRGSPSGMSKWERIGKPLFTPSIEMAMYFTPMNPIVYRMIRAGLTAYDVKEGVYDDNY
jgi:hypothetical protein